LTLKISKKRNFGKKLEDRGSILLVGRKNHHFNEKGFVFFSPLALKEEKKEIFWQKIRGQEFDPSSGKEKLPPSLFFSPIFLFNCPLPTTHSSNLLYPLLFSEKNTQYPNSFSLKVYTFLSLPFFPKKRWRWESEGTKTRYANHLTGPLILWRFLSATGQLGIELPAPAANCLLAEKLEFGGSFFVR
jgi:hypothetical protein